MSNPEVIFESYGNKLIGAAGGGSESGGHTIQDAEGTDLAQQDTLQFADARVENDDTNGKTVVHVTQEAMTVEEFNEASDLPPGIYPLDGGGIIDDSMIKHDAEHTTRQVIDSKVNKSDLASISITGTTNNTGAGLLSGTYFYLNGTLCITIAFVANGDTFVENTNYKNISDALNKSTPWKYLGNKGVQIPLSLPSDFEELYVIVGRTSSVTQDVGAFTIPKIAITSNGNTRRYCLLNLGGGGSNKVYCYQGDVIISNGTSIYLQSMYYIGTDGQSDVSTGSNIWVYYR